MQASYVQVYTMQGNLFSPGAPVVIVSGALIQDTQTGQPFAQLVLENIGPVPIVSMKLALKGLDPADRPLTEEMEHFLLDLNAPRGAQFAGNSLFPMPHPAVRSFSFRILEIIFADKTIWSGEDCQWSPLPASRTLEAVLGDEELIKQYRLEYGQNCLYAPVMLDEVYLCSCGAVNRHQHSCAHCGASPSALSDALITRLREKTELRLEQEAQQAEQLRQLQAEQQKQLEEEQARKAEQRQKKKEENAAKWAKAKKKILRTAIWSVVAVVLVFALLVATHFWILPEINYRLALNAIQKKDYENAHRLFTILEDYRDTEEYLGRFVVRNTFYEYTYDYSEADSSTLSSYGRRYERTVDQYGNTTWYQSTRLILDDGRFVPDPEEEEEITEYGKYTYNSAGNPTEWISEDQTSRSVYTYNNAGKLIKKEDFSKANLTGQTLYTYDGKGNLLKEQVFENEDLVSEILCTYDGSGNLTKKQVFEEEELVSEYLYSYNSNNDPTKEVAKDIESNYTNTTTYQYHANGKVSETVITHVDHEDPEKNSETTTTYSYTITGELKKEEREYDDGRSSAVSYRYNVFNELVEVEEVSNGETSRRSTTTTISYNVLGQITQVEVVSKYRDKEEDTAYSQKISAEVTCRLDGTVKEVSLSCKYSGDTDSQDYKQHSQYDESGREIERKTTYDNGMVNKAENTYEYFYFPEGTLMPSEY